MVIKRIGALSCARIMGLLYAFIGLLMGGIVALISLAGGLATAGVSRNSGPFAAAFGVSAIIIFPILYGLGSFVLTLVAAWIYNVLAGMVGGIELDVTPTSNPGWNPLPETRVPTV